MPQKNYRAYAQSPAGKAARARAHAKYAQKRKGIQPPTFDARPLAAALSHWRTK